MLSKSSNLLTKVAAFACAGALAIAASSAVAFVNTDQALAKSKTMYVIKAQKSNYKGNVSTISYTYNKKGLIAKSVNKKSNYKTTYSYTSKGYLKTYKLTSNDYKTTRTYSYKNGRLVEVKEVETAPYGSSLHTIKYGYASNGSLKTCTDFYDHETEGSPTTFTTDKKKRIIGSVSGDYKTTYKYDKKGNLKSTASKSNGVTTTDQYKNTYKNGRLAKTVVSTGKLPFLGSFSYTYKKIKVPAKMVSKVKAEQWALINKSVEHYFR